ncbi:Stealth protein CR1, conserved region 1 [Glutamicibacter creatinolyticus]|uniref:Stealth protein CR1, conserved region 1 n=1 Tax=Glutamicibacter creatinolyticus TaxID=162496 RepID=A0A5B7WSJ2_9MICC|nr:stealth conserved region 3 domain-containing protein [Glutamicibacter creatinolyticus]QCY46977.1 Stealth protein CR1, conserved region 1 [Glutamicibacter creatinolyticus]
MKIAFILTTGDTSAGTEHAIQSQAVGLRDRGYEISIYSIYRTNGRLSRIMPDDIKVTYWLDSEGKDLTGMLSDEQAERLSKAPSTLISHAWDNQYSKLTDIVCRKKIGGLREDAVVTTTPALAMLASYFLPEGTMLVAEEHRASMRRGVGITPLANVVHDVDAIISLNNENAEWIRDRFPEYGFVSAVIPNSIPDVLRPRAASNSTIVMAAGRFAPGKQFDQLLEAFSLFKAGHPDWTLRLFGEGPGETKLRELIGKLNLHDSVEIITGVTDLTAEWAEAGIHAMTSKSEGQPLVILEASAAGVPTVAYDCPIGPRNILTHGIDGLLVPLNDTEAFAQTLASIAGDTERRAKMSSAAIQTAKKYSPKSILDEWEKLYSELAQRRTPSEPRVEANLKILRGSRENETVTLPDDLDFNGTENAKKGFNVRIVEPRSLSAQLAQDVNQKFVKGLLMRAEICAVEIPSYSYYRQTLAIREEDSLRLLQALSRSPQEGVCVRAMKGNSRLSTKDWHPGVDELSEYDRDLANVFRVFIPISDELRRFTFGSVFAVDIEVWSIDQDAYVAPRSNPGVDRLLNDDFLRGSVLPEAPLWDEINFPIDAVYTWVDDSDQNWRRTKDHYDALENGSHPLATGSMRFKNRDELRYSIRSVRTFMPWIRNIYVVTADQYPTWLSEESDIQVITHSDIFPDKSVLPVFNSHAIEACLHRVPGLAEHFLYFNDDTLLMRMQDPRTYFHGNGAAKFFMSSVKIDTNNAENEPHMWAARNNRKILFRDFGKVITRGMLHTPYPHRRSVLSEIESEYPEVFKTVRASRFRSPTDISLLSSFAQHYGYFVNEYIPGSIRYAFCSMADEGIQAKLSMLQQSERFDVVTFGEGENPVYTGEQIDGMMDQFFRSRFPYPVQDEIGSTSLTVEDSSDSTE